MYYILYMVFQKKNILLNIFLLKASSVKLNFLSVTFYFSAKSLTEISSIFQFNTNYVHIAVAIKVEQKYFITISVLKNIKF